MARANNSNNRQYYASAQSNLAALQKDGPAQPGVDCMKENPLATGFVVYGSLLSTVSRMCSN